MAKPIDIAKVVVEDFVERRSIAALLGNVTDDVVHESTTPLCLPLGGAFRGKEGIGEYYRRVSELMEIGAVEVEGFLEMSSKIVVVGREEQRILSTGEVTWQDFCVVFTFRGDLISRVLVIEDHCPLFASLRCAA